MLAHDHDQTLALYCVIIFPRLCRIHSIVHTVYTPYTKIAKHAINTNTIDHVYHVSKCVVYGTVVLVAYGAVMLVAYGTAAVTAAATAFSVTLIVPTDRRGEGCLGSYKDVNQRRVFLAASVLASRLEDPVPTTGV